MMKFKIFPYEILQKAMVSYKALMALAGETDDALPADFWDVGGPQEPVVYGSANQKEDQLILVSGGLDQLKSACPKYGCLAWLTDRKGKIKHVWHHDPTIWNNMEHLKSEVKGRYLYPMGLHMYENGDLLVSYQAKNAFPVGVGLAKFDKDSNLIWKREDFNNHWFEVTNDGRIYAPAMRVIDAPLHIGDTRYLINCEQTKIAADVVTILSPDGKLIKEIDILDAIIKSGYAGTFHGALTGDDVDSLDTCDPTHLNDVRVFSHDIPSYPPDIKKGDFLVSLRSLNAVGILDPDTERFKWFSVGLSIRQHSPRYDGNGGVIVLDNKGGSEKKGGSRVVRVDLQSRMPVEMFPKMSIPEPKNFYTGTAGHLDLSADRKTILITSTHQGEIWEMDLASGKVVWRYVNNHMQRGRPARFPIYTSKYIQRASFIFNRKLGVQ